MRGYARVLPSFWTGATGRKIRALGPVTQLVALAVDHGRRGRRLDHRRVVRRNPTSGFDMQRPAGSEAAKGIVDPHHGRDQAGFGGAREVGSAKAKAGLQRAVLV